jgi:hypothetical protein
MYGPDGTILPTDVAADADLAAEAITHFGATSQLSCEATFTPTPDDVVGILRLPGGTVHAVVQPPT